MLVVRRDQADFSDEGAAAENRQIFAGTRVAVPLELDRSYDNYEGLVADIPLTEQRFPIAQALLAGQGSDLLEVLLSSTCE